MFIYLWARICGNRDSDHNMIRFSEHIDYRMIARIKIYVDCIHHNSKREIFIEINRLYLHFQSSRKARPCIRYDEVDNSTWS